MNTTIFKKGFTVLELLIIIGIMTILMALVLTSLNSARKHSNDERKVSALRTVAVELREYFNICRQYPVKLDPVAMVDTQQACATLQAQSKTIRDIIPTAYGLDFDSNDQNGNPSRYHYVSLVDNGNPANDECTNFHAWVELENDNASLATQKSNKTDADYAPANLSICYGNSTQPLTTVMQGNKIFDIFK